MARVVSFDESPVAMTTPSTFDPDVLDNLTNSTPTTTNAVASAIADAERALVLYVLPVIIVVGTLGNVTSLIVLLRSRMCQMSSVYFFLVALAVADTTVLYVSAFKTWIRVLTSFELLSVNNISCRLMMFLITVSQNMAAWIVVLVTVDRFVAVWFPLRATSWCTVSRAWVMTLATTVLASAYGLHVFWTYEITYSRSGMPRCYPAKKGNDVPAFMLGPIQKLNFATYCALPFLYILSLNVAIIVRLRRTSPALRLQGIQMTSPAPVSGVMQETSSSAAMHCPQPSVAAADNRKAKNAATTSSRATQQAKVTYMLLTVSMAWLVLTSPFACYTMFVEWPSQDVRMQAIERLAKVVCFLLMYANHAVNFFLYCVTGRKFRRELQNFVWSVFRCRGARWLTSSPSVKTLRSNCAELEPLNNDSSRVVAGTLRHQNHQCCYVTDVVNDAPVGNDSVDGGGRNGMPRPL